MLFSHPFRWHRQKRHKGTGEWFLQSDSFKNWLSTPNSFLWLHGLPGCGKSVLLSTAVDNIKQFDANAGLAYFYFDFKDPSKQNASGMLRSLIVQLLECGHETDCVRALWQSRHIEASETPLDELVTCLSHLAQQFANLYIVLDALDVCPQYEKRDRVLESIATMRKWSLPALHVLVSSHDITDIRQPLNPLKGQEVNMKNVNVDRDISKYVYHQLTTDRHLSQWKADRVQLQATLEERTQGVFLYAASQLEQSLKVANTKADRDALLENLPRDMNETYERLLRRIKDMNLLDVDNVRRVMTLLCYSSRPLTTIEVCHAFAVNLQNPSYLDLDNRLATQDQLCNMCCNLIEITQVKSIGNVDVPVITISHSLLRQYFESKTIRQQDLSGFAIDRDSANRELAEICLVYLKSALSEETKGLEKISKFPFALFAAMEWFNYYLACGDKKSGLHDLALQLFDDEDSGYFDAWIELYNVDAAWGSSLNSNQLSSGRGSPLYYASILELDDIVDKIASNTSDVDVEGGRFGNALQAASVKGYTGIVQLLLKYGADVNKSNGAYGTALQAASAKGHTELVNVLLGWGADPNIQFGKFGTALQAASSVGNKKIVQILLEHKADPKIHGGTHGSALQAAKRNGHEEVKKLLLDEGADSSPGNFIQDLMTATILGNLEKMEEILNEGKEHPNDVLQTAKTCALLSASFICHDGAVKFLLENGANVNAQAGTFGSALYCASLTLRDSSQQLFYELLLHLDVKDTALQGLTQGSALESWLMNTTFREESNWKQVLELLSAKIINDSSMRSFYKFMFPLPEDSEKVVRILLENGANVNEPGGKYGNALQAASYIGNDRVVELLLENGADINSPGGFYCSAIDAASAAGHSSVMQMLKDHQGGIAEKDVDQPNGLSSEMNDRS
ncbi:unnamed protein product [Penicillium pancosmium]